jgi:DNA transformation protein and related proteins
MAASPEFLAFIAEQLAGLGPVSIRKMFGGAGVYHGGAIFGLVVDDVFYLKADEASKAPFEAEGLEPFSYGAEGGKKTVMSYWRAPARCLDEPDAMRDWAMAALSVARKAAKPKR